VLGHSVLLNDVYYAAEIEEVSYVYEFCTVLSEMYHKNTCAHTSRLRLMLLIFLSVYFREACHLSSIWRMQLFVAL